MAMIENELQDFQDLEQSFKHNKAKAIEMMNEENNEIDIQVKKLKLDD